MSEAVADYIADLPVSELSDNLLMKQVHLTVSDTLQQKSSMLLEKNREGQLTLEEEIRYSFINICPRLSSAIAPADQCHAQTWHIAYTTKSSGYAAYNIMGSFYKY
ncbi:MAG: hypothetical protein ACPG7F_15125 [Aggregatilineales bacterium]